MHRDSSTEFHHSFSQIFLSVATYSYLTDTTAKDTSLTYSYLTVAKYTSLGAASHKEGTGVTDPVFTSSGRY